MDIIISLPAFILGAILYGAYGGVYYSLVLKGKKNPPLHYVLSVVIAFACSYIVGLLVHNSGFDGLLPGIVIGFSIGVIIALVYLKNMLFGLITRRNFTIAVFDHVVALTLLGTIHGLFH